MRVYASLDDAPTHQIFHRRHGRAACKSRFLSDNGQRTFAVVLESGDEAIECLTAFASEYGIDAGHFTGLGAFRKVTLGYFDFDRKDYKRIPLNEQVEIVSLVGNFATEDGETRMHPHVVVARSDGSAFGGHLLAGEVRPIVELVVEDEPAHLRRHTDPETGLALLKL